MRKSRMFLFGLLWIVVLLLLPIILSSWDQLQNYYVEWGHSLAYKNNKNMGMQVGGNMQNISVVGMITRIFSAPHFPLMAALIPGGLLMLAPLLRLKQYLSVHFQLHYLAAVLLSIVLFSTSSESPTYIIAVSGAAIYFVIQKWILRGWNLFLLIFMLLLTSFSPTDIFPRVIRKEIIQPYALKALPCLLVWLTIVYKLLTHNFKKQMDDLLQTRED